MVSGTCPRKRLSSMQNVTTMRADRIAIGKKFDDDITSFLSVAGSLYADKAYLKYQH